MYDPTFHYKALARHLTVRDFQKDNRLFDPIFKTDAISRAVTLGREGFPAVTFQVHSLRGKSVYQLNDISETLVLRHMNSNVRRITHVKQTNRQIIVDCIKALMSEGVAFNVFKYDIKSFYESVDTFSIVDRLKSDPAFSGQSVRSLESFFVGVGQAGITGLPRGLSISATLSEYTLRYFDEKISNSGRVWYYARFVDDILVITDQSDSVGSFDTEVRSHLPNGLKFNSKSRHYEFLPYKKGNNGAIENTFNFLGYQFAVGQSSRTGENKRSRIVLVDLAPSKVRRLKTRFAKSLVQYKKDSKFTDLQDRIKLLTGNFRFVDSATMTPRVSGIYFNYPLVDATTSDALKSLDKYARNLINSPAPRNRLRPTLTPAQRAQLSGLTFASGFTNRRFFHFNSARLADLVSCWAYA